MTQPYPLALPSTSLLAEQLVGMNTKIADLQAQRVTYVAGQVTALNNAQATFAANILQPDGSATNVSGIRTTAQFMPTVGNVVTLALSGAQIIYLPNGVAPGSIDTPQLSTSVTTTLTGALGAVTTGNVALSSGQNLVPDPSFENGYLTSFTAPFSLDTTFSNAHTGSNSIKAVANAGAQNMVLTPQKVPILQGHSYRLSAWRKTDASYNGTSGNGKLKIVAQDGTTVVASAVWTQGTTYAQVQTTYTVPSDGSVSSLQVVIGTDHTVGTLWVDDAELMDITDALAAQTTAAGAVSAAASKIITFFGTSPPVASEVGDLWINTSSNQTMFRWSGAAWVQVQDQQIQSALTNAAGAQVTANSKIITFIQGTVPTASEVGDFWADSSNGNKLFRWSGAAWVSVQDAAITNALAVATAAQTTANTKILVFAQPTQPLASEVGDIWFNTGDGMKMFVWGPTKTVTRQNQANNPSFENQAVGTVSTVSSWNNSTVGTLGTVTRSIVSGAGVSSGAVAAKSVSSSQAATAGTYHGFQQSYVAAPGNVWRIQATAQLAVTGANFVPFIAVEYLDNTNTVLNSTSVSGSGTLTGSQLLVVTTPALPAGTASVRVTLERRTVATTGSALVNADIIWDSVLAERNRDSAAPTTYFDGGTLAATNDSKWDNPVAAPNSTSTAWMPGISGVNGWQLQQFRTGALASGGINGGAIATQTILGNDAIAYGSITAPLLESLLVLTGTVIAGNVNADHAALATDGLHLFRTIAGEGLKEVGTLAVGAFGTVMQWINSTGAMVAQVDEGGAATFVDLNVDDDPVFQGQTLSNMIFNALGGTVVASSYNSAMSYTGITSTFGLGEVSFIQDNSRSYMVNLHIPNIWTTVGGTRALICMRVTTDGSSPTTTTGVTDSFFYTMPNGSGYVYAPPDLNAYGNFAAASGSKIRILATISVFDGGGNVNVGSLAGNDYVRPFRLWVSDMGPNIPDTYIANTGGGGVASFTTYDTGAISQNLFGSWRGNGTLRTDTTDVVQGTDPSGFNGDGKGGWNFPIPNIFGTVNWVQLFIYSNFTYFNSGAHALIRPVTTANTASPTQLQGVWDPGVLYPKPGGVTVTLPSSWNSTFTGKTSIGIYLGPSSLVGGAGNELYYLRADGPSAKLRINYTQ